MNDYSIMFFPVFIGAAVLISLGEWLLLVLWIPFIYRYAIPLYRKEYNLQQMPDLAAQIPALEQKLPRTMWQPAIVFKELSPDEIAFRNYAGSRSRNQAQGLVQLNSSQNKMTIKGNLPYAFVVFPLLLLILALNGWMPVIFAAIVVFFISIGLVTQRNRYGKIADVIAETAVIAEPSAFQSADPIMYNPQSSIPQSGLSNLEIFLILFLGVLIIIAVVLGYLFLSGS